MLDIEKQYRIAESMIGSDGRELVHLCYELIAPKLKKIEHQDTYFYRVMRNEVKSGRWQEHKTGLPKKSITYCLDWNEESLNSSADLQEKIAATHSASKFFEYNPIKVQDIIKHIELEGFREEVQLFKRHAAGDSITQLNIDTNVCRRLIKECINFVQQSVIERYGDHHS